jgi:ATP-binding cassette, subfamily F, member 3
MSQTVLTVHNLEKSFNIYPIFTGVSFTLNAGERVALVGPNGVGKSTVLKIIAGIEPTTGGAVVKAKGVRVVYVAQEAASSFASETDLSYSPDETLFHAMLDAIGPVRALGERLRELEGQMSGAEGSTWDSLMQEYERVTTAFEQAGGYDVEHRIEEVLEGLGFRPAQYEQTLQTMSGGQRTRAALARALVAAPDLLLLDEPTNHLDIAAIEWLEGFLLRFPGTLLCIAHDRRFLNKVTQRTLDMEFTRPVMRVTNNGRTPRELGMQEAFSRLQDYPAPYDKYLVLKAARYEILTQQYEAQQEQIARTQDFIRRYKDSQKSKQAAGRLKRLLRTEKLERPTERSALRMTLRAHVRSGHSVFEAEDLVIGYKQPQGRSEPLVLARAAELEIERGERVALIGPNGAGKTTLLRTMMGQLEPLGGHLELGHNVRFGYYAQAHEGLEGESTVLDEIRSMRNMTEEEARDLLAKMLFVGDNIQKRVADLSGGERSRVALTKLMLTTANFLILDEPTNHLDLDAQEALTQVLTGYDGTILFVSHDRAFIDDLATQIWNLSDGVIQPYNGNYSEYVDEQARHAEAADPVPSGRNGTAPPPKQDARDSSRATQRQERAAQRERDRLIKRKEAAEAKVGEIEARLNSVSDALTAATEKRDLEAIVKLGTEYSKLEGELDDAYAEWQRLEEEATAGAPA